MIKRELTPTQHLVDNGYTDAELFVSSQRHDIDLVSPASADGSWQAKAGAGFDTSLVSRLTGTTKSQPVPGAAERHLVGWHR
ncbi:MAG: hypothetical protein R2932_40230 [Caldilineaceae bacterium]